MMAMEYHHPGVDIRSKEQALNLACSFLRPVDTKLKAVLAEACMSNKIQLNMKLGQKMITELQFYEIDPDWLGSESEDYEADQGDEEKDAAQILKESQIGEEAELTPMEAAFKVLDDDSRIEDMRKVAEEELNLEEYKVQPAINQCMTDFFTFDHPNVDEVEAEVCG